ncbi:MAG: CocE/NonD family hydrolase [Pseudomonadota bacterium]
MKTVTEFPFDVEKRDPVFIELSDGTRLAATLWLPVGAGPVPAILEYLPYRRRDGTAVRDALTHPYFAGHGYACVRVDVRGSGDSDGVITDEYLPIEQDDALEVIAWLTAQDWCSGQVGMIGISWGGFNGLQVAARQPEALKAIVTICSTDDRYSDDIHYMGGALLMDNPWWHSFMFSINTSPPDPQVVGDGWRDMWLERLRGSGFWLEPWLQHQRRDAYWQQGSVCEDFGAIQAAVYAVGGWADGYSNAVFRLLEGLDCPRKGLVGPWAHKYPHFAKPGPAIGFLQECLRWWDYWLKGITNGIMDEPQLRAWVQDYRPPAPFHEERPGRWVSETSWPASQQETQTFYPGTDGLAQVADGSHEMQIRSPQDTGSFGGHWCAFGLVPDGPGDQRGEEGGSLVFDSAVLDSAMSCLGAPELDLVLSADRPVANVIAVLSDVAPDGAALRVSFGVLNLTHRDSHADPEALTPGTQYQVRLRLNDCGHRFAPGHRIRLAVSSAYWPIVWPAPEPVTLTLHTGQSRLHLPCRTDRPEDAHLAPFAAPEAAAPLNSEPLEPERFTSRFERDVTSGRISHVVELDEGRHRLTDLDGWTVASGRTERYSIHPDDPLSCSLDIAWTENYARGNWQVRSQTTTRMHATRTHFVAEGTLTAWENDQEIETRHFTCKIARDLV